MFVDISAFSGIECFKGLSKLYLGHEHATVHHSCQEFREFDVAVFIDIDMIQDIFDVDLRHLEDF